MTLYQPDPLREPQSSKMLALWGVPVEPCIHGNTGEHVVRDPKRTYHPSELCAGVGEETP